MESALIPKEQRDAKNEIGNKGGHKALGMLRCCSWSHPNLQIHNAHPQEHQEASISSGGDRPQSVRSF